MSTHVKRRQNAYTYRHLMTYIRRFTLHSISVFLLLVTLVAESIEQHQQHYVLPQQNMAARQWGGRVLARGYNTNQNARALSPPASASALIPAGAPQAVGTCASSSCSLTGGYDYNPALLGGQRGLAGIKARINSRGFQYFSTILTPILIQQIRRARIPNINQCIPQVNGCIQVYNLYVSRFRCPQRIVLYPAAPNLVVLAIENLDIGVTGNLGGQINIILPIALYGIVQMNAHQLSARVSLTIDRGPTGSVAIRVVGCQVTVGYVDVYVENGGLIGDIANSQFRGRISEMVRSMLPTQLCNNIPSIVNEQLNSKLTAIPQSIALSQLLQVALNSFGISNLLGGGGGAQCACPKQRLSAAPRAPSSVFLPQQQKALLSSLRARNVSQLASIHASTQRAPHVTISDTVEKKRPTIINNNSKPTANAFVNVVQPQRPSSHTNQNNETASKIHLVIARPSKQHDLLVHNRNPIDGSSEFRRKRQTIAHSVPASIAGTRAFAPSYDLSRPLVQQYRGPVRAAGVAVGQYGTGAAVGAAGGSAGVVVRSQHAVLPPPPPVPGTPISFSGGSPLASGATKGQLVFPAPGSSTCNCPTSNANSDSPLAILSVILTSLDFNKLSNIYLTVQFLQGYATINDYTVDLNGEFSPGGLGGTPFGAFPMQFSTPVGLKMAEILISDWTVNSLFYHLHRVGFISIRIGPETPKIGDLLKTSCSSEEDLEDHGVETDIGDSSTRRRRRNTVENALLSNVTATDAVSRLMMRQKRDESRIRRQDDGLGGGSLSDLGICLGDILPAVREKHPNEKIVIHIHTARAPSVVLSARNGGTATLDFVLDADLHIQTTNVKVGTIQVAATIDFAIKTAGGRISAHADITNLQLRDMTGTLGLPQDGLDNLGNLGKELLLKAGNEALEKGAPLNFPANLGGLPLTFVSPEVQIVEHALHIGSDFTVDPNALGQLGLSGSGC